MGCFSLFFVALNFALVNLLLMAIALNIFHLISAHTHTHMQTNRQTAHTHRETHAAAFLFGRLRFSADFRFILFFFLLLFFAHLSAVSTAAVSAFNLCAKLYRLRRFQ